MSVTQFDVSPDDGAFAERVRGALRVLAAQAGYLHGMAGPATDDPQRWVIVTEWRDVGSYRRALGRYDVRVSAAPLLAEAIDAPSAFERLIDVAEGGAETLSQSDRQSEFGMS